MLDPETVIEYSIELENFMGFTSYSDNSVSVKSDYPIYMTNWDHAKFHESWDWLMPVFDKWRDEGAELMNEAQSEEFANSFTFDMQLIVQSLVTVNLEATFIKLYKAIKNLNEWKTKLI